MKYSGDTQLLSNWLVAFTAQVGLKFSFCSLLSSHNDGVETDTNIILHFHLLYFKFTSEMWLLYASTLSLESTPYHFTCSFLLPSCPHNLTLWPNSVLAPQWSLREALPEACYSSTSFLAAASWWGCWESQTRWRGRCWEKETVVFSPFLIYHLHSRTIAWISSLSPSFLSSITEKSRLTSQSAQKVPDLQRRGESSLTHPYYHVT